MPPEIKLKKKILCKLNDDLLVIITIIAFLVFVITISIQTDIEMRVGKRITGYT